MKRRRMQCKVRVMVVLFSILMFGNNSFSPSVFAQQPSRTPTRDSRNHPHSIRSISVCSANGTGSAGSCPTGSFDTHQIVLAPDGSGNAINAFGPGATSDEHTSIFSPGAFDDNSDYLFFVASGVTQTNRDVGMVVLSGGTGPDNNGQWTMNFASGYGAYSSGFGTVFRSPTREGLCPDLRGQDATHQDQTFDLNYAAAGSVVKDPTSHPGHLLMIYEGSNACIGSTGGVRSHDGAFLTTGVATSFDYGHSWPTYRGSPLGGNSSFTFTPLPDANPTQGPNAPFGALGSAVCPGNDCGTTPPANYGRYAALTPPLSLATLMATGQTLSDTNIGDSEPAAFVDDASPGPTRYVYVVHSYIPGSPLADNRTDDLTISQAQLNGGSTPLSFLKWNGQAFAEPGLGGVESPILPDGAFENCSALTQSRHSGSISYVDETHQYLLTFVCNSPGDPVSGSSGGKFGSAWFYSTSYDLSDPGQWTPPQEITGSWMEWDTTGGCPSYKGWYPSLMSLDQRQGHLSTRGYVFYMWGCLGGSQDPNRPKRQFSSRAFTITTN